MVYIGDAVSMHTCRHTTLKIKNNQKDVERSMGCESTIWHKDVHGQGPGLALLNYSMAVALACSWHKHHKQERAQPHSPYGRRNTNCTRTNAHAYTHTHTHTHYAKVCVGYRV